MASLRHRALALLSGLSASVLISPVAADTTPPPAPGAYLANDYSQGHVLSVLPPGENGLVNAADAARYEAAGTRPPNAEDQRIKYANLLYAHGLTDSQLGDYYNEESFGVRPGDVVRTETPSSSVPVTILRDKADVPHVYGQSLDAMAFGAGYAAAEDRLFMIDVLRHYGSGTLSSFLGPTCAFEQMDHDQLLLADYSPAEKQAQIDAIAAQNGTLGEKFKSALSSYTDGINAYITATQTDPRLLPADYAAAGAPPQPWTPTDVIDIASLVGGIFGKGGGVEMRNAALLQYLQRHFGADGPRILGDLREQNDPQAPVTITDKTFPYEIPGTIDPSLTAMPDDAAAPLTGGPTDTTPGCNGQPPNPTAMNIVAALLALPSRMSNALLVDAKHSASGHPLAVMGPQVAYFTPEILMEEDLHAPDFDAEGAAFPGTNLIVELGRGQDFAWSATSAGTDNVDTRLEIICDPGGGTPAAQGTSYLFQGRCVPMEHKSLSETAPPKPGCESACAPAVIDHEMYDTVHGVVQGWTTSGGKPVAVVIQRSTYGHELDSGIGFAKFCMPSQVFDVASWMQAASDIQYTFNWFYADSQHIASYTSGKDPIRPSGEDPTLPTWGDGRAEWQGFLDFNGHPHEVDPPQGFFTNWNNKPAAGFSAADDQYGYGQVYRVQSLSDEVRHQFTLRHGRITRADLVTAMITAATRDLSGSQVLPDLLRLTQGRHEPAGVRAMLDALQPWLAAGAPRHKAAAGESQYADANAVAIMDELFPRLQQAFFGSVVGGGGTDVQDGLPYRFTLLPMVFADTPHGDGGTQHGSAYDGGYEGYDQKILDQVLHRSVRQPFSGALTGRLCGSGLAGCAAAIDGALADTYDALVAANGNGDVGSWTLDTAVKSAGTTQPEYDAIIFQAIGLVAQPHIDWQNRPTFQQVVEFPAHRPAGVATVPELPVLPLSLLGASLTAMVVSRRRRRPEG
jgi:acyl-homoserine lactone acylase PvdQ